MNKIATKIEAKIFLREKLTEYIFRFACPLQDCEIKRLTLYVIPDKI